MGEIHFQEQNNIGILIQIPTLNASNPNKPGILTFVASLVLCLLCCAVKFPWNNKGQAKFHQVFNTAVPHTHTAQLLAQ